MAIYLNPKARKAEAKPVKVVAKQEEAMEYTVAELKAMCEEQGLTGYSKMTKAELTKLLEL